MLTIKDILMVIISRFKWIALTTVLFAIITCAYTYFYVAPIYSSTASLYVVNNHKTSTDITTSELAASQKLVKTYMVVLKSNTTLQQVAEKLEDFGYYCSVDQLRKMISTASINDTEAFSVTVSSDNPEFARTTVKIILNVLPNEIIRVVDAGAVRIIDDASNPTQAYFPIRKNLFLGAFAGFSLSVAVVLLIAAFDTKVHGEERIRELFEIPIIGCVPSYGDGNSGKNSESRKNKKGSEARGEKRE